MIFMVFVLPWRRHSIISWLVQFLMKNVVPFYVKFLFSLWVPLQLSLWFWASLIWYIKLWSFCWFCSAWSSLYHFSIWKPELRLPSLSYKRGGNDRFRTSENHFLHQSARNSANWSTSTFFKLFKLTKCYKNQGALIQEKKKSLNLGIYSKKECMNLPYFHPVLLILMETLKIMSLMTMISVKPRV